MYKKIINPKTNRKILITSKLGKQVLLKYMNLIGGSAVVKRAQKAAARRRAREASRRNRTTPDQPATSRLRASPPFYDSSYKVKFFTKDGSNYLKITAKNAKIEFKIDAEEWKQESYYKLKKNFTSDLRLSGIYAKDNKLLARAPKGFSRKIMCYGLMLLIKTGKFKYEDTIVLEADGSTNNDLIHKVYEPMGFIFLSADEESEQEWPGDAGGLMAAKIKRILKWCTSKY